MRDYSKVSPQFWIGKTGLGIEGASKGLARAIEAWFCLSLIPIKRIARFVEGGRDGANSDN